MSPKLLNGPVLVAIMIFLAAVYNVIYQFFTAKTSDGDNIFLALLCAASILLFPAICLFLADALGVLSNL